MSGSQSHQPDEKGATRYHSDTNVHRPPKSVVALLKLSSEDPNITCAFSVQLDNLGSQCELASEHYRKGTGPEHGSRARPNSILQCNLMIRTTYCK